MYARGAACLRLGLIVLASAYALPTDYRSDGDTSYYINAVCQSKELLFVGGLFNVVGNTRVSNFGFFDMTADGGRKWVSPPVTIGADPSTLAHSPDMSSPAMQGRVLTMLCPPDTDVVILGGDFTLGGLRWVDYQGLPIPGAQGVVLLNHMAVFRLPPGRDVRESNLCPVVAPDEHDDRLFEESSNVGTVSCMTAAAEPEMVGALYVEGSEAGMTGVLPPPTRPWVATMACLNERCTDIVVGGRFNVLAGVPASSVARLVFDTGFYTARTIPLHEVKGRSWASAPMPAPQHCSSPLGTISGVDGSVRTIAVLNDSYVLLGGLFTRAGDVATSNVAVWHRQENRLVCLGQEVGPSHITQSRSSGTPNITQSRSSSPRRCQGLPGEVRVSLVLSPARVLLGGSFVDVSSPTGAISANLAVLELQPQGWTRLHVADAAGAGYAVGTNGPVTSASCTSGDRYNCSQVLVGGWFDALNTFRWGAPDMESVEQGPSSPAPSHLALLDLSATDTDIATLRPLDVSTFSPNGTPMGRNGTERGGVNILHMLVGAESTQLLAAGSLSAVGNMQLLELDAGLEEDKKDTTRTVTSSALASPWVLPTLDGGAVPRCWSRDDGDASNRDTTFTLPPSTATFCCLYGSMCPYEGLSVPCPRTGGYHCVKTQSRPDCCEEGYSCNVPGNATLCPKGTFCPRGSMAPIRCSFRMWCHKPGMSRPERIMAGVVGMVLVAMVSVFVGAANEAYVRIRNYLRLKRESQRKARERERRKEAGDESSRSSSVDAEPSSYKQQVGSSPQPLLEPLLGGGCTTPSKRQKGSRRARSRSWCQEIGSIDLQFESLSVTVPGGNQVLKRVTGGFRSGRVTAVMGPSGCGKTTLLGLLCNRLSFGSKMTGAVYVNGIPQPVASIQEITGFVPQDDIMHADLTVKEELLFASRLRSDPRLTRAERVALVEGVLESLGLQDRRHTLIGSVESRGISGGQRKRVNVAMELISRPLVLFLDEPTSGLDSTTSDELLKYLHRLSRTTQLTIGAVIHQPRVETFLGVDDVIFLGKEGRVAFYGPATDAQLYFTNVGLTFPAGVNPADVILDGISRGEDESLYDAWTKRTAAMRCGRLGYWCAEDSAVGCPKKTVQHLPSVMGSRSSSSSPSCGRSTVNGACLQPGRPPSVDATGRRPSVGYPELLLPSRRYPSVLQQTWTCLIRSVTQQHNTLAVARHDMVLLITFGLLVGLFDLQKKQYELAVLSIGLTSTLTGIRFFNTERVIFWRECASGISISSYYLGRLASAVPLMLLYPLAFLSLYYNMGFPRVSFGFYYVTLLLASWVCFGVGIIISVLFEPKSAQIAGVVMALLGFLFGGHSPDISDLNKSFVGRLGMSLSYVRWSVGALLIQDTSLAPACSLLVEVGGLQYIGYLPDSDLQHGGARAAGFDSRSLETEVVHCRQVLVGLCFLYVTVAMLLVWLSGKYRANTLGWSSLALGMRRQWVVFKLRLIEWARDHHGYVPAWVIDALAGYAPVPEDAEDEEDEDGTMMLQVNADGSRRVAFDEKAADCSTVLVQDVV